MVAPYIVIRSSYLPSLVGGHTGHLYIVNLHMEVRSSMEALCFLTCIVKYHTYLLYRVVYNVVSNFSREVMCHLPCLDKYHTYSYTLYRVVYNMLIYSSPCLALYVVIRSSYLSSLIWGQTSHMNMMNPYMLVQSSIEALCCLLSLIYTLSSYQPRLVLGHTANIYMVVRFNKEALCCLLTGCHHWLVHPYSFYRMWVVSNLMTLMISVAEGCHHCIETSISTTSSNITSREGTSCFPCLARYQRAHPYREVFNLTSGGAVYYLPCQVLYYISYQYRVVVNHTNREGTSHLLCLFHQYRTNRYRVFNMTVCCFPCQFHISHLYRVVVRFNMESL